MVDVGLCKAVVLGLLPGNSHCLPLVLDYDFLFLGFVPDFSRTQCLEKFAWPWKTVSEFLYILNYLVPKLTLDINWYKHFTVHHFCKEFWKYFSNVFWFRTLITFWYFISCIKCSFWKLLENFLYLNCSKVSQLWFLVWVYVYWVGHLVIPCD